MEVDFDKSRRQAAEQCGQALLGHCARPGEPEDGIRSYQSRPAHAPAQPRGPWRYDAAEPAPGGGIDRRDRRPWLERNAHRFDAMTATDRDDRARDHRMELKMPVAVDMIER